MHTLYKVINNINIDELKYLYANARPFPHVIVDNFFPEDYAKNLEIECRNINPNINVSNNFTQKNKNTLNNWALMPDLVSQTCNFFNSGNFLDFIEHITTIEGLISDPFLEGGGLHQTKTGGYLKMHTDFNWNKKLGLNRRINVLFYLNSEYKPQWGGKLYLSERPSNENIQDMTSIEPIFNRLVIFNTNDTTFHGHPLPLNFPIDYPRTSLAYYYYTSKKRLPKEVRRLTAVTSKFVPAKDNKINSSKINLKSKIGYLLRRWTPFG